MGKQDTLTFIVTEKDLDKYDHMNNAVYSKHYKDGEILLLNGSNKGNHNFPLFMPYITRYKYNAQLRLGDEITIITKYIQKDNLAIFEQKMYSQSHSKQVGEAIKKKKNRTNENLSFNPHVFNVFVSNVLEKGRKGIQGVHKLTIDKLIDKKLALVVTSSDIKYLNLNRLIRSLKGSELTLESQLGYAGGMELLMRQTIYSQNGHRGDPILTAKSKHILLDTEHGSVCRHPLEKLKKEKILAKTEIPQSKYELDWKDGIERLLEQSNADINSEIIKSVHPILLQ